MSDLYVMPIYSQYKYQYRIGMGMAISEQVGHNKLQHECLGVIELVCNIYGPTDKIRVRRQTQSLKKFNDWERQIRLIMSDQFREVLYLPDKYSFVQQGMCGTSGYIEMQLEYYKFGLKNQIWNRHQSRTPFQEVELWYLMYNLLEAAFLLYPLGRRIGDVHPNNIMLNQKGRLKIIPVNLFPNSLNNYQKMVQQKISDVYLAPEQIDQALLEQGTYPNIDPYKAQVFSIGLTLLTTATLTDCYYLYDRKILKFNSGKKKEYFKELSLAYSQYFCSIVGQMLEQDPKKRRTSTDFFKELNKYQSDILSLREFNTLENRMKEVSQLQKLDSVEPSIAQILRQQEAKGRAAISLGSKTIRSSTGN